MIDEVSNFDAATINAEYDDIVDRADTRTLDDVRPRAFQRRHLVSLTANENTTVTSKLHDVAVPGPTADFSGPGYEQYVNALSPDPGNPKDLQVFNGLGPVGGVGWNVVSRGGADDLRARFAPGTVLAAKEKGIYVTASIAIGDQDDGGDIDDVRDHGFSLGLAIRTAAGALYCITRSVRSYSAIAVIRQRLTVATFITADDIANAGGDIRDVVLIFGRFHVDTATFPVPSIDGQGFVELGPATISALPLRAGDL